jgi:hypothetical protein
MIPDDENKLDKCIIVLENGNEYKKISDVPENEYFNVHTLKDMNPLLIKTHKYFKFINKFINLRFISCDTDDWNKTISNPIINNIACFEKLSILAKIDYITYSFVLHDTGSFIWENKMTFFCPSNTDLLNICGDIQYLNIISDRECDYMNIPYIVTHLHISINDINSYMQSNLPMGLHSMTVTIPEILKRPCRNELYSKIRFKTKLPFGCELILDDVFR